MHFKNARKMKLILQELAVKLAPKYDLHYLTIIL